MWQTKVSFGEWEKKTQHVSVSFASAEIQNASVTNSAQLLGLTNQNKPSAQHKGVCFASVCIFSTAQPPWSEEDRDAVDGVVGWGE